MSVAIIQNCTSERPIIALLENDPAVRRSLQLLLQAQGYDVRAHHSGRSLIADPSIDDALCLIADYRLDDGDGIEVLMELRARNWSAPAILITAYPSAEVLHRARSAGFAVLLDKPLRPNILVKTVKQLARQD